MNTNPNNIWPIDIVGCDFDNCLSLAGFPHEGKPNVKLVEALKEHVALGGKWFLWTCREGKALQRAVDWCHSLGLDEFFINESDPVGTMEFSKKVMEGIPIRKPYAALYIDDLNGRGSIPRAIRILRKSNRYKRKLVRLRSRI